MKLAKNKLRLAIGGLVTVVAISISTLIIAHDGWGKHGGKSGKWHIIMTVVDQIDVDKDGTITHQEIEEHRQQTLTDYDANQDNTLQLAEFEPFWLVVMHNKMVDHFQYLDQDGDGQVTDSELAEPLSKLMTRRDKNNDNALSHDEFRSHHKKWGYGG